MNKRGYIDLWDIFNWFALGAMAALIMFGVACAYFNEKKVTPKQVQDVFNSTVQRIIHKDGSTLSNS